MEWDKKEKLEKPATPLREIQAKPLDDSEKSAWRNRLKIRLIQEILKAGRQR